MYVKDAHCQIAIIWSFFEQVIRETAEQHTHFQAPHMFSAARCIELVFRTFCALFFPQYGCEEVFRNLDGRRPTLGLQQSICAQRLQIRRRLGQAYCRHVRYHDFAELYIKPIEEQWSVALKSPARASRSASRVGRQ